MVVMVVIVRVMLLIIVMRDAGDCVVGGGCVDHDDVHGDGDGVAMMMTATTSPKKNWVRRLHLRHRCCCVHFILQDCPGYSRTSCKACNLGNASLFE